MIPTLRSRSCLCLPPLIRELSDQGGQGKYGLQQAARQAAQGDPGRPWGGLRWLPGEVRLRRALQGHGTPRTLNLNETVMWMDHAKLIMSSFCFVPLVATTGFSVLCCCSRKPANLGCTISILPNREALLESAGNMKARMILAGG